MIPCAAALCAEEPWSGTPWLPWHGLHGMTARRYAWCDDYAWSWYLRQLSRREQNTCERGVSGARNVTEMCEIWLDGA